MVHITDGAAMRSQDKLMSQVINTEIEILLPYKSLYIS